MDQYYEDVIFDPYCCAAVFVSFEFQASSEGLKLESVFKFVYT